MKYSAIRDVIQDGDLICFRGGWWISKRIVRWQWLSRLFGRSSHQPEAEEFSHTGVAVWMGAAFDTEPRLWVIESTGGGVRAEPLSALIRNYVEVGGRVCWRALNAESGLNGRHVAANAVELCGKRYASRHLIQYLYALLGIKRDVDPDGFICSEATGTALQRAGLDCHPASMKPCDVVSLPIWQLGIHELTA